MIAPLNIGVDCKECGRIIVYQRDSEIDMQLGDTIKFSRIHADHVVLVTSNEKDTKQDIVMFKDTMDNEFTQRIKEMISGLKARQWNNIVIVSTYEMHLTTFLDQVAETIENDDVDLDISSHKNYIKLDDGRINYTFFKTFEIDEEQMGTPDISYIDFLEDVDKIKPQKLRNLSILITESQMTVMYIKTLEQQQQILAWLDQELRMDSDDFHGVEDGESYAILINKPGMTK